MHNLNTGKQTRRQNRLNAGIIQPMYAVPIGPNHASRGRFKTKAQRKLDKRFEKAVALDNSRKTYEPNFIKRVVNKAKKVMRRTQSR